MSPEEENALAEKVETLFRRKTLSLGGKVGLVGGDGTPLGTVLTIAPGEPVGLVRIALMADPRTHIIYAEDQLTPLENDDDST